MFDALDPMEWLTVGLLVFAAAQVFVQARSERVRTLERQAEVAREADHAFQLVWAEHFRLEQLANLWQHADLMELSAAGLLDPQEVLPRDWTATMSALARISVEPGFLGGVALSLAKDIAAVIAMLNGTVGEFRERGQPSTRNVVAVAESFFSTLELELIDGARRATRHAARRAIFEFIETWYNRKRRHSSLGYRSPIMYEQEVRGLAA